MNPIAKRPRVFVTQPIAESALDRIKAVADVAVNDDSSRILAKEALLKGVAGCDFLLPLMHDKIDRSVIAANPDLLAIASMAITPTDIDIEEATRRGVVVTTAPPLVTEATADLCFGLMIAVARRIIDGDKLRPSRGVSRRAVEPSPWRRRLRQDLGLDRRRGPHRCRRRPPRPRLSDESSVLVPAPQAARRRAGT